MTVLVVGISHKSAPTELLGRLALADADVPKVIHELVQTDDISEALVLSTCNRLEVYADVSRFHGAVAEIGAVLARAAGVAVGDLADHGYVHFAHAAAEHLLCVAAGLDSMVVGEAQILGQLRGAYATAVAEGSVGRELHAVVQAALHTGKRVHTETGIDRAGASVASIALDRAETTLGPLAGRRAVVVGAGAMGGLVVSRLAKRGVTAITVVNRTLAGAERLAATVDGTALALSDRPAVRAAIAAADLLVSVTGSARPVLGPDVLEPRPGTALVVLDLALPGDVAADAAHQPGLTYVDLDALRDAGPVVAADEIAAAERIVAVELRTLLDEQQQLAVAPTVSALRARAESVIEAELRRLDGRLPDLDAGQRAEVATAVRRAVEKLLHAPTVRVKELAGTPGGDYAAALRTLFDLDPASVESVAAVRTEPTS